MASSAGIRPQPRPRTSQVNRAPLASRKVVASSPRPHAQQQHPANEAAAFLAHLLQSHPHMHIQQAGQQQHHALEGMAP